MTNFYNFKLLLGLYLISVSSGLSAEVEHTLSLPVTFEYESNPQLLTANEESVSKRVVTPTYSVSSNDERTPWNINANIRAERSSNQVISQDRDDAGVNIGLTHYYETGQLGIVGLYQEQSTRESEFSESGLVNNDNTRRSRNMTVNWLTNISDKTSLSMNGTISSVDFIGASTAGLVDYKTENINARLNYTLNDNNQIYSAVNVSYYQPNSGIGQETETRALDIGAVYNFSEQLTISAGVGVNETREENQDDENGWQANLDLQYVTLRSSSNLKFSRYLAPSSTGGLEERYLLTAGWSYSITDFDKIDFGYSWNQVQTTQKTETSVIALSYTGDLSESWNFRFSADHRIKEDNLSKADSNRVMASMIYNLTNF